MQINLVKKQKPENNFPALAMLISTEIMDLAAYTGLKYVKTH